MYLIFVGLIRACISFYPTELLLRAYFHNTATKESVWEVPAELADNPEVAHLMVSSKMTVLEGADLDVASDPRVS